MSRFDLQKYILTVLESIWSPWNYDIMYLNNKSKEM